MKTVCKTLFLVTIIAFMQFAQTTQTNDTKVKFELSGFVRADAFVDSRQTISLRDNAIIIAPTAKIPDIHSEDINDAANLTMVGFHTRLGGKVTGFSVLGAKATGYFEGEFFGMSDNDINGFRLRHSFIKLDWENTSILFGQYWHPMACADIFPSFSFGAPFMPYSRNPQFRITQKLNKNFSVAFTAMTERDFTSSGPDANNNAVKSNTFLKNAVMPMLDVQLMARYDGLLLGANADYKSLKPRLVAQDGTKTSEKINSFATTFFGKIDFSDRFSMKFQGVYGQNIANLTMGGGYAIKAQDSSQFTNMNVATAWAELCYGKEISYNVFFGYSKNLGTTDNTNGKYFGFLTNVDEIFRIAPNVAFYFEKLKITTELDYTSAIYGNINAKDKSKIINDYRVENYRLSLSCTYPF